MKTHEHPSVVTTVTLVRYTKQIPKQIIAKLNATTSATARYIYSLLIGRYTAKRNVVIRTLNRNQVGKRLF